MTTEPHADGRVSRASSSKKTSGRDAGSSEMNPRAGRLFDDSIRREQADALVDAPVPHRMPDGHDDPAQLLIARAHALRDATHDDGVAGHELPGTMERTQASDMGNGSATTARSRARASTGGVEQPVVAPTGGQRADQTAEEHFACALSRVTPGAREALIGVLAHELWQRHGDNDVLNWLEAERFIDHLLALLIPPSSEDGSQAN